MQSKRVPPDKFFPFSLTERTLRRRLHIAQGMAPQEPQPGILVWDQLCNASYSWLSLCGVFKNRPTKSLLSISATGDVILLSGDGT